MLGFLSILDSLTCTLLRVFSYTQLLFFFLSYVVLLFLETGAQELLFIFPIIFSSVICCRFTWNYLAEEARR